MSNTRKSFPWIQNFVLLVFWCTADVLPLLFSVFLPDKLMRNKLWWATTKSDRVYVCCLCLSQHLYHSNFFQTKLIKNRLYLMSLELCVPTARVHFGILLSKPVCTGQPANSDPALLCHHFLFFSFSACFSLSCALFVVTCSSPFIIFFMPRDSFST